MRTSEDKTAFDKQLAEARRKKGPIKVNLEVFSDKEKEELLNEAIINCSKMLKATMIVIGIENFITGTVEFEGQFYELSFIKVDPKV